MLHSFRRGADQIGGKVAHQVRHVRRRVRRRVSFVGLTTDCAAAASFVSARRSRISWRESIEPPTPRLCRP